MKSGILKYWQVRWGKAILNLILILSKNYQIRTAPVFYALIMILFQSLTSCTESIPWDLKFQEKAMIVVEAKITNEGMRHEVILTEPVYEMNGIPSPVSGARVRMSSRDTVIVFHEDPQRAGIYIPERSFRGVVNKHYFLDIEVDTFQFRAISRMVPVTPIQDMSAHRVQTDPLLFELWISNSDEPAMLKLEMDWSHLPGYDTLPDADNHATLFHYTLESIDVNEIFSPEEEHIRFPPGTVIQRTKESVSVGYEEFLRGMLSETSWRGGVFDVMPGNAFNNFDSDRVLGYFVATTVIRDTVTIRP